jgi:hypothetical protein
MNRWRFAASATAVVVTGAGAQESRPSVARDRDRPVLALGLDVGVSSRLTASALTPPSLRHEYPPMSAGAAAVYRAGRHLVAEARVDAYGAPFEPGFVTGASADGGSAAPDADGVVRERRYRGDPTAFVATTALLGGEWSRRALHLRATAGGGWMWQPDAPFAAAALTAAVGSRAARWTLAVHGWHYALRTVEQDVAYPEPRRRRQILGERAAPWAFGRAIAVRAGLELSLDARP